MDKQLTESEKISLTAELALRDKRSGIIGGYCEKGFPLYYANSEMAAMLGYDSIEELSQAIGGMAENAIHPEDLAEVRRDLGGEYYEGMTCETTCRMLRKDGTWLWTASRGKVIKTESGRLAMISVCSDMRDLIRHERELERSLEMSEQRYEIIMALGKVYKELCVVDLENRTYSVVSGPAAARAYLGRTGPLTELHHVFLSVNTAPEQRSEAEEFLDFSTLGRRLKGVEYAARELRGRSGHWFLKTFIVKSRNANGEATRVLLTARDITEQKIRETEYQESLRKAMEEARSANEAKTEFLRRMSHDIRTPINGIIGMLKIAERHTGDAEKIRDCTEKALSASRQLMTLVSDILDIGKLESDEKIVENRPFDLKPFLIDQVSTARAYAARYGVTVYSGKNDCRIAHRNVIGSAQLLNRVLMNLSGNAVKYNRPGGSVRLTCSEHPLDGETSVYKFVCEDTGIGMSEEFQKHAFEPYTQEGKRSNTSFSGTGLGLAIVKKIADQVGGSIELESRENVGTRITVTVPLKLDLSAQGPESREKCSPEIDISGGRALIAEDNELNREIAEALLAELGISSVSVKNGEVAVERFAASAPGEFDYILMDVMMPVMDGVEAARRIRALGRADAASVPILAISANAFQDDIRRSLDAGMTAHLTKPLEIEKIRRALQEAAAARKAD